MSVSTVTFYDTVTGKINSTCTCLTAHIELQTASSYCEYVVGSFSSREFYIDTVNKVVEAKTELSVNVDTLSIPADGITFSTFKDIPEGIVVLWPDGFLSEADGNDLQFSVDLAGTYTFRFTAVPYLDKEITIEAIAAT